MKCAEIQATLRSEDRSPLEAAALAHLSTCAGCRTVKRNYEVLGQIVADLPPPALPDGFDLALRRRLETARAAGEPTVDAALQPPKRGGRSRRLLAAAAALIVVIGAALLFMVRSDPIADPGETCHRLRLEVTTDQALPAARFEVRLPEGVSLAHEAGDALKHGAALRWRSRLKPGVSTFDLPLVARRDPREAIRTVLVARGKTYTSTARLKVSRGATGQPTPRTIRVAWVVQPSKQEQVTP